VVEHQADGRKVVAHLRGDEEAGNGWAEEGSAARARDIRPGASR
jgi:hypothetical protein